MEPWTFNRTILELKHINDPGNVLGYYAFNRTILELKQGFCGVVRSLNFPFNRTILELKQQSGKERLKLYILLIEPFWN